MRLRLAVESGLGGFALVLWTIFGRMVYWLVEVNPCPPTKIEI